MTVGWLVVRHSSLNNCIREKLTEVCCKLKNALIFYEQLMQLIISYLDTEIKWDMRKACALII